VSETPDVASSTDGYAARFTGPAGEYLLAVQTEAIRKLSKDARGGTVLDVGGGHAQLAGLFLERGCGVTILGSDQSCFVRPTRYFDNVVKCVEGDLLDPPFPDRSFDLVVAIRMLAHLSAARRFVQGLCRVARRAVIVDYPDLRSFNALVPVLYGAKEKIEGNTRTYRSYRRRELLEWFRAEGFGNPRSVGQFFWPMVLHRKLGRPSLSRGLERLPRALLLDRLFGSPVLLRVDRQ
jgi:SAM-dependent methyltransferase